MEGSTPTADTGAATIGPTSFSDTSLTWTEDSSASTPSPETTDAASANADATVPPAPETTPDVTPAPSEPPQERWADILKNARTKAAEEALAPLAWAQGIDPQEFSQIQTLARHLYGGGNPVEGLQTLIAELRKDPQVEAQIRSFAARTLASRSQQPAEAQEPQPDLPIQLEDGRVVHLYSAEQQAKREAFLQQKWMQGVQQELQPLKQSHEQAQKQQAEAIRQQQVTQFVTSTYEDVQTWPGMQDKAVQAAVAQELSNARIDESDPREVSLALNAAYRKVVLPTLSRKAEARTLDTLQRKAAASTTVNPGSAAASTPKPIRSFHDLGPEAWR